MRPKSLPIRSLTTLHVIHSVFHSLAVLAAKNSENGYEMNHSHRGLSPNSLITAELYSVFQPVVLFFSACSFNVLISATLHYAFKLVNIILSLMIVIFKNVTYLILLYLECRCTE